MADVSITAEDPRWVGAWWIGFIISGMEHQRLRARYVHWTYRALNFTSIVHIGVITLMALRCIAGLGKSLIFFPNWSALFEVHGNTSFVHTALLLLSQMLLASFLIQVVSRFFWPFQLPHSRENCLGTKPSKLKEYKKLKPKMKKRWKTSSPLETCQGNSVCFWALAQYAG